MAHECGRFVAVWGGVEAVGVVGRTVLSERLSAVRRARTALPNVEELSKAIPCMVPLQVLIGILFCRSS